MYKISEIRSFLYLVESPKLKDDATPEEEEAYYNPKHPNYISNPVVRTELEIQTFISGVERLLNEIKNLTQKDEERIQSLFYDVAKTTFGETKEQIREFFKLMYLILFSKDNGPRWGQFVLMFGVDEFVDYANKRFEDPLSLSQNESEVNQ